jgi:hypothetical protein
MGRHFAITCAIVLGFIAAGLSMAQTYSFVGTWKLNVAKSHYDPGPGPKSQTRTWDSSGKVTVEGMNAKGESRNSGYTMKTDGKEHPANGGTNGEDSITNKLIDANTIRVTFKKDGKQIEVATYTVSENGKLLTIVSNGVNPGGHSFHNVQVFEKQ